MSQASPFKSILVPLDGSPLAEQAIPLATGIARPLGAKVRLALVHQLPPAPLDPAAARLFTSVELATRKSERAYLRGVQATLREKGVRLSAATTLTGLPGPTLAEYVGDVGIDLVVMATHGRGGLRRTWLGSVADYLVRTLEVPVMLMRPPDGQNEAVSRGTAVLVPLDGSPLAEEALGPAAALARAWEAELVLLNVVAPVVISIDGVLPMPSAYDEELTGLARTQAQDYLDDIIERLRGEGARVSGSAIVAWAAVDAILEAARHNRAGAIALATHGRGGLRRAVLGSVADKLVRSAEVPVLVCRPTGRTKSRRKAATAASRGRTRAGR